jgi:hypothetical protein
MELAFIKMITPDIPTQQDQHYCLTAKGIELKKNLEKAKKSL